MTQPLGLTYKDMINQELVNSMNAEVKALLIEWNEQGTATQAIDTVADAHGFLVVEQDDGTTLIRNDEGYAVIWYESQFGQARFIHSSDDYEQNAIGFDNQELGWGDVADEE